MLPSTNHELVYLILYPFVNVYVTLFCVCTLISCFFYKFVASKNFPPKSLMPRVTSNLLAIKQPTNLFSQHGISPGNVFVHVASSVGNLKFLEDNLLIPSSGVKSPKRSPETSVRNYHYSLRKEARRKQFSPTSRRKPEITLNVPFPHAYQLNLI